MRRNIFKNKLNLICNLQITSKIHHECSYTQGSLPSTLIKVVGRVHKWEAILQPKPGCHCYMWADIQTEEVVTVSSWKCSDETKTFWQDKGMKTMTGERERKREKEKERTKDRCKAKINIYFTDCEDERREREGDWVTYKWKIKRDNPRQRGLKSNRMEMEKSEKLKIYNWFIHFVIFFFTVAQFIFFANYMS